MNVDQMLREHAPDASRMRRESDRLRSTVLEAAVSAAAAPHPSVLPRVRRRRTVVRLVAAATVLVVTATGLSLTLGGGTPASAAQRRFVAAAPAPAYETYGAFSAGTTVYIGNHQVTFDEKIKSMYYTSEGVLVRTGRVAYLDDGGPSHYELIRPDGSHTGIDLRMGDRVVATDPQSPNVAYAEPTGDRWSFVVIDLVTGDEVARTTVGGAFTWGGWEAPPVTMSGHRMWALFDDGWVEYDWRAGTTRLVPGTRHAILEAAHGRYAEAVDREQTRWRIKDFVTGRTLRTFGVRSEDPDELDPVPSPVISPDGRFVKLGTHFTGYDEDDELIETPGPFRFIDVDSGEVVDLDRGGPLGWTPGGNTLEVDAAEDRLTVCYPASGRCDRIDLPISGRGPVKLGGSSYES